MIRLFLLFSLSMGIFALDIGFQDNELILVRLKLRLDKKGDQNLDEFKFSVCSVDQMSCIDINSCFISQEKFLKSVEKLELNDEQLEETLKNVLNTSFLYLCKI